MTLRLAFAMALALAATPALAGLSSSYVVDVNLSTQTASGDYRSARNSPNNVENIGCWSSRSVSSSGVASSSGFCQAKDAAGETLFCFTPNADLINSIGSISDYSYVSFSVNSSGECRRVYVSTQSQYLPAESALY